MRLSTWQGAALAALLVFVLGSCGSAAEKATTPTGSTGPGPTTPKLLDGDYFTLSLLGDHGGGSSRTERRVIVSHGFATSDGQGTLTVSSVPYTANPPGGTVPGPGASDPYDVRYEEAEDGILHFFEERVSPVDPVMTGRVSANGQFAILSSNAPFSPLVKLFVRKDSAYTATSFTNSRTVVGWYCDPEATIHTSVVGGSSFSTSEDFTIKFDRYNVGSMIVDGPVEAGGQWWWADDGTMGMSFQPGAIYYLGGCGGGGSVTATAGTLTPDIGAGVWVYARTSEDQTLATFSGAYTGVGFVYEISDDTYRSFRGTVTPSGDGTVSFRGGANIDGEFGMLFPVNTTYTVNTRGVLTMSFGGGRGLYVGQILEGGEFAVLAGGGTEGTPPGIFLLVKRP